LGKLVRFQYSAATVGSDIRSETSPNTNHFMCPEQDKLSSYIYLEGPKILLGRIFFMPKFITKNKKIVLLVLIFVVSFGVFFLNFHPVLKPTIELSFTDTIPGQITVYDFMSKLQSEGKINFTEKNYIGMGKFIETINGIKGTGNRNWIYYVNGKEAQIGVSNYKINPGDIVSWKYGKENY